jgi:hypothetical protein
MYRDSNPTFYVADREDLGTVLSPSGGLNWDSDDIDTISVLTDDINRDSFTVAGGALWCYYGGCDGVTWSTGLTQNPLTVLEGLKTTFWVKVADDLSSSAQTIYVYYGKADATSESNADDTFLLFDDFSGAGVDWTNKWQSTDHASYSIDTGRLKLTTPDAITKVITSQDSFSGFSATLKMRQSVSDAMLFATFEVSPATFTSSDDGDLRWSSDTAYAIVGGIPQAVSLADDLAGVYTLLYLCPATGDATLSIYDSAGNLIVTKTGTPTARTVYLSLLSWANGIGFIDDVLVRKYVSPEPQHGVWGTEETGTTVKTVLDSFALADAEFRNKSLLVVDAVGFSETLLGNETLVLTDSLSFNDLIHALKTLDATDNSTLADEVLSPSRVLQINENVSLVEVVQSGAGIVKKTRLFLFVGELAVQLTGE